MSITAPFGTWASPISAADTVGGVVDFAQIALDGQDLYWVERRPSEGGRQVLVHRDASGRISDLTPAPVNVRTRVHEYGGGSFVVGRGRVVYSEFSDQRLYLAPTATPITPEPPVPGGLRYADGRFLPDGSIVCVRESHGEGEAVNEIARVDPSTGLVTVLASGRDFYASPRPSPEGDRLAWLEWDHPNMPWDGTELMTASITDDGLTQVERIAGGSDESVFQPEWAPTGDLVFATDRSGWWNLHRFEGGRSTPILTMEADFGLPAWIFGFTTYGFLSGGRLLAVFWEGGVDHLAVIDADGRLTLLPDDLTCHAFPVTDGESRAWFVGFGAETPNGIYELDVGEGELRVIRSNPMPAEPGYVPKPRIITYPTGEGEVAHGVFYPPANPDYQGPEGERPPLIVKVHGGPTSHVYPRLRPDFMFWTTRGFGLVDINYRGGTSYGRKFRNRLRDSWGIVDVEDSLAAARYLAEGGEVDGDRLVITGGSAGGYTTLAALAFGDAFSAGASYYGVADIRLLADHTHKFESRYLDGLVGTDREEMRRRSPLNSVDQITVPVILFQGLDDLVVPPEQAEVIADALAENGIPHAHITYEGEDHGFRKAENLIHSLESELVFYGEVFGFTPAGDLPPVSMVRGKGR
ncbi:MAG: S9 family peptidase [Acidimicrobiia bacterium]